MQVTKNIIIILYFTAHPLEPPPHPPTPTYAPYVGGNS